MSGGSGRPTDPSLLPGGPRPKNGSGFGNVRPPAPPAAPPPRDNRPIVPPLPPAPIPPAPIPPAPIQGALTTGPGGFVQAPLAPDPFSGVPPSQGTNLFGFQGPRPSEMDKILQNSPGMPNTPTKTQQGAINEALERVNDAIDDEELLQQFRARVSAVRGDQTVEQRKDELRRAINPWINAGIKYGGTRRPGLFLPDGTRNPARAAKGAPGWAPPPPPPPPAGGTGPGKNQTGTNVPPPAGTGNKSSTGTGNKSSTGTGNKSSTGAGNKSSTGAGNKSSTGPGPRPPGYKGPQILGGSSKNNSSRVEKNQSSGSGNRPSKVTAKSPLSKAPLTTENVQSTTGPPTGTGPSDTGPPQVPPQQPGSRTAGAGWRRRDDLFEANVMNEAGITWATGEDTVTALPTLQSTIDYNTDNWE